MYTKYNIFIRFFCTTNCLHLYYAFDKDTVVKAKVALTTVRCFSATKARYSATSLTVYTTVASIPAFWTLSLYLSLPLMIFSVEMVNWTWTNFYEVPIIDENTEYFNYTITRVLARLNDAIPTLADSAGVLNNLARALNRGVVHVLSPNTLYTWYNRVFWLII